MRDVILISTKPYQNTNWPDLKTLITNEIEILPLDIDLSQIDSLVFTSKNAVKSLVQSAKINPKLQNWESLPCYVIGEATARALKAAGANISFVGSDAHGASFAKDISPLLIGKKPLYIRAKTIVSGLDSKLLSNGIKLKQVYAYENHPKKLDISLKPSPDSVIIFISPSGYVSFKSNFNWDGGYVAVAIGNTTFSVFDGDVMGFVSPEQNIEKCIEFAYSLANKLP